MCAKFFAILFLNSHQSDVSNWTGFPGAISISPGKRIPRKIARFEYMIKNYFVLVKIKKTKSGDNFAFVRILKDGKILWRRIKPQENNGLFGTAIKLAKKYCCDNHIMYQNRLFGV